MAKTALTGSRIRDRRIDSGIKQAELARRCEISASYLNLIEHNRRRIGGGLLNRIAGALEVEPAVLSEGAEGALTTALQSAAVSHSESGAEIARVDDFAGRFPGWARLIERQHEDNERLRRTVEVLNDRLTYDPHLAASMHDVLSTVTSIRSTSAILADDAGIEPEWQARFHRNLYEDSQRLALSAEGLVDYLEASAESGPGFSLPQDVLENWLASRGWRIEALEDDPDTPADGVIGTSVLASPAARVLGERFVAQYRNDVRALPADRLARAMDDVGEDPITLADATGQDLACVFRRLAAMPDAAFVGSEAPGLVICDGSGALTYRKPVTGFDLPRYGTACAVWPLFQALRRPTSPLTATMEMDGRDRRRFVAHAVSNFAYPSGYAGLPVVEALMLIRPAPPDPDSDDLAVGTSCRICAQADCSARREPSILALGE